MERVLGWFTKTMRRQIDNATPTIHPRLLAPKQAGQHRLNKINRHLRATSRVVMPLHHFPWMPLNALDASNAPECPWCCCWASNQAKTRKCTQVLLHEFWVLGLWVLYSVVYMYVGAYSTFDFNNDERSISCLSVFSSSSSALLLYPLVAFY